MGKIIAFGGGDFGNGEMSQIVERLVKMTGKTAPKLLIVPTAQNDCCDGEDEVGQAFEKLGCTFDMLFLIKDKHTYEEIERIILGSDIIFVHGGNLLRLMNVWTKTGAVKAFKKAYEKNIVLCGASTGAMCWFQEGYDDCGENGEFMFVEALGLIPYSNCPHYQSENWQTYAQAIKTRSVSGIACDNGAGFGIEDGKYFTVCGNEGGDCYFYDKDKDFSMTNLCKNPEKLAEL